MAYLGRDLIESRSARACYALVCCTIHIDRISTIMGSNPVAIA